MKLRIKLSAVIAGCVVAITSLAMASSAHAAPWGGDGDPQYCANPQTVKSVPLVGSRGPTAGKVIGVVQLRWSWSCHGNWSRVQLYGSTFRSPATVEQKIESEGRAAGSTTFNVRSYSAGSSTWTPYLRLANSQSYACAQAWVSSDFDTLNFHTVGARVCA